MCIDTYNNDDVQPYPNLVPSLLCNTYFNSSPDPSAHDNDSFHSYSVLFWSYYSLSEISN